MKPKLKEGQGLVDYVADLEAALKQAIEHQERPARDRDYQLGNYRKILRRVDEMLSRKDSQKTISEYIQEQRLV